MITPLASALSDLFEGNLLNLVYMGALFVGVVYAIFLVFFHGVADALGHLDLDVHTNFDLGDHDTGDAVGVSMLAIASFVSAFGASGLIAVTLLDAGSAASLGAALLGGLVVGILAQLFFVYILSPTVSSEVRQSRLIGMVGEIITPIPENGVGQIALVAEGTRVTYSARSTKHGQSVPRGMPVRIERISGGVVYVAPVEQPISF
ncbi:MAG TPA: NfeD family protein [Aggregatilinea sp.]|uniref:NfeD family protein n=1 Tax=Aggregatilinea sp. TaxID=2806333 RepID=UPI002BC866EF|nr:NfeD family protein [Aggregatilinea sp.]HML21663.1 NfeD family protein [Aggregatilinea sp.]